MPQPSGWGRILPSVYPPLHPLTDLRYHIPMPVLSEAEGPRSARSGTPFARPAAAVDPQRSPSPVILYPYETTSTLAFSHCSAPA